MPILLRISKKAIREKFRYASNAEALRKSSCASWLRVRYFFSYSTPPLLDPLVQVVLEESCFDAAVVDFVAARGFKADGAVWRR